MGFFVFGVVVVLPAVFFLLVVAYLLGKLAARLVRFATLGANNQYKWESLAKYGAYVGVASFLAYSVYFSAYPDDEFYLSEFKEVTLREPPKSAKVIASSASYPDFHGDYCSYSRIEISTTDYAELLADLESDARLKAESPIGSNEEQAVLRSIPVMNYEKSFTRAKIDESDHHLGIKFMKTRKHIEVSVCVT